MATGVASDFLGRAPATAETRAVAPAVAVTAFASIGAGAIHAAAIGVHSEHRSAVVAFTILAVAQIGFGVLALLEPNRIALFVGAGINVAAMGGWILAKTSGIGFIDGLDVAEDPQWADSIAFALATVSVIAAIGAATWWRSSGARLGATTLAMVILVTALITTPAMLSAGSHSHAGGHDDGGTAAAGDGHAHGDGDAAAAAAGDDEEGHEHDDTAAAAEEEPHEAAVVPPKPYDPTKPIDLGGVEGVTPEQQARAENLIAITLLRLPKYADPATAEADGFRSIGDAVTGDEHYRERRLLHRRAHPQPRLSRVARVPARRQRREEARRRDVHARARTRRSTKSPTSAGSSRSGTSTTTCASRPRVSVAGLRPSNGECSAGLNGGSQAPMIHVWIQPHPCGPFAALDGVGAGQIKAGETKLCDSAHGARFSAVVGRIIAA